MSRKNYLQYKGYVGSYEISLEDDVFFGKVEFIKDLISYEGANPSELKASFEEAINDYLKTCKAQNREPDHPFKGSLNIRIGEELHRKIALSLKKGQSINSFIKSAVEKAVS